MCNRTGIVKACVFILGDNVDIPSYKPRTHQFLLNQLKKAMNKLQLRDWEITLSTDAQAPAQLRDKWENAGSCVFWDEWLQAVVWINVAECRAQNMDPLHVMLHELAHIWLGYCENEERQCNVIGGLLMGKGK